MAKILHLVRALAQAPCLAGPEGVRLRTYVVPADTAVWLDLRTRAFAGSPLGVRPWTADDFDREFLAKPWWRAEHLWFAESDSPVGTVTLAFRGAGEAARPVVHWLAVAPEWRRRGIGRLLVSAVEARAWELGYREVWLETHAAWEEAVRLYRALGYGEAHGDARSP
jgi:GNAT superfamily N-acetyltransferase